MATGPITFWQTEREDMEAVTQLQEAVEDRRAQHALVHGVMKSRTRLNN